MKKLPKRFKSFTDTVLFHLSKRTSIDTKRLDSVSRSYIYTAFAEQLNGMACIRSTQQEDRFIHDFQESVDNENRISHIQIVLQRWLSLRVLLYGNVLTLAIGLFGVGMRGTVSAAKLGLVRDA